ncbi:MAG: anthranilate synthase component I, partial [Ruaniaceae bacterium]|nr:anthranilate synthase component I [Ruaniaceae bacterium]
MSGATLSLDEFRAIAASHHRVIPVARRVLAEDLTPTGVYRRLGGGPGSFILESAEHGNWDRWSFVGIRSRATLLSLDGTARWLGDVPAGLPTEGEILEVMRETLRVLATPTLPDHPPLTGGMVGALGCDFV